MLSGGVESTALVQYGLKKGYEVETVHVVFDNKTLYEGKAARKIAEFYDVPYSEVIIDNGEFNNKYLGIQRADHPWWACGVLICAPVGNYDEVWFGSYLGESAPGAQAPSGAMLILQSADCWSMIRSPLYQRPKIDQWNMLPSTVKSYIVSCIKQYKDGKTCWEAIDNDLRKVCQKCKEWKKWNIVRDA